MVAREFNPLPSEFKRMLHPTLNEGLVVDKLSAGSGKKLWWVCELNHNFGMRVNDLVSGHHCPYCVNSKVLAGFNDLVTTYPDIASEWHPDKNGDLDPSEVLGGSSKKRWWLGRCGHEWEATVGSRCKLGRGCPYCVGQKVLVGVEDLQTTHPNLVEQWHPAKNGVVTPETVTANSSKKVWWVCEKNHEFDAVIRSMVAGKLCSQCSTATLKPVVCPVVEEMVKPVNPLMEKEIVTEISDILTRLGLTVTQKTVDNVSYKIFVSNLNVAIEVNVLPNEMHDNNSFIRNNHYQKWLTSKNNNITLFTVWEDDWVLRKKIVLRSLAHKLGVSVKLSELYPEIKTSERIFGRKTSITTLTTAEAQQFLNLNHIQGFASGTKYLGLKTNDNKLCAVMVLKVEPNNTLNIVRYATEGNVVGGFTKILKYATTVLKPEKFITFADHCVSDGGLYANNGFIVDKELKPDYMYVVNGERKHKFGFRIIKFKNNSNLKYVEGLTERELAHLNGLPRVWDAGKTRYVFVVNNP